MYLCSIHDYLALMEAKTQIIILAEIFGLEISSVGLANSLPYCSREVVQLTVGLKVPGSTPG